VSLITLKYDEIREEKIDGAHSILKNWKYLKMFGREREERSDLEEQGVDARMILKYILGGF